MAWLRSGDPRARMARPAALTVSNLGGSGIESFAAVINPPESAILAVGKVMPGVTVVESQIAVQNRVQPHALGGPPRREREICRGIPRGDCPGAGVSLSSWMPVRPSACGDPGGRQPRMQEQTGTASDGLTLNVTRIVDVNPCLGLDCGSSEGAIA